MRVLVIQLARLGDIYMSWPALRALKRLHPEVEIDILTRDKFKSAVEGLEIIRQHHILSTANMIEPIVADQDISSSLSRMQALVESLRQEKYDWVINLSFSSFSSYLTHALSSPGVKVSGYTRHEDGYFNFSDDLSAYFYAQVGIGRSNRVHVCDLFAALIGVELDTADWSGPASSPGFISPSSRYIVIHIGASQANKSLPGFKWARAAKFFLEQNTTHDIVLIGSEAESAIADEITGNCRSRRIINRVGQTSIREIFDILRPADLLVGCDSAPMHMASLTHTPCFNLSFATVNFWESGPRSFGSVLLLQKAPDEVSSEGLGRTIANLLNGDVEAHLIPSQVGTPSFYLPETDESRFNWDLIQALYLGETFPVANRLNFVQAVEKIRDLNQICIENLSRMKAENVANISAVVDRIDEVLNVLAAYDEGAGILVRWYQAQKIRIPPLSAKEVLQQMGEIHSNFERVLKIYSMRDHTKKAV